MRGYAEKYPKAYTEGRLVVIPNGYDETAFSDLPAATYRRPGRPLRLVHSGVLYPDGRNPLPFFTAVANLKAAGVLTENDVTIVLRASGFEAKYTEEIRRRGLDGMITLAPLISNLEAVREQADADALLLFQGRQFDDQIPSKVYEYLRIGRPVFALVSAEGDAAALLRDTGGAVLVPMEDVAAIERGLCEFIKALREQRAPVADASVVQGYSRQHGAVLLARLLDDVVG